MSTMPDTDPVVCLAQADLLLLLAEMLKPPTSWGTCDRVVDDADLLALAERSLLERRGAGAELLTTSVAEWRAADVGSAAAEYRRLFDGALVCAPNETEYVRRDKGAVLADIAGFYRAFGFQLADGFREKHDHAVAELQFVAVLSVQLGRATALDDREVARGALRGFLGDHLGLWLTAFCERLETTSTLPFYGAVARLARGTWETMSALHQLGDVDTAAAAPAAGSGTPYECGMCEPGGCDVGPD